MDPHRFASVILPEEYEALVELIDRSARALRGRVIWNVNSTARAAGSPSCCARCSATPAGRASTPAGR